MQWWHLPLSARSVFMSQKEGRTTPRAATFKDTEHALQPYHIVPVVMVPMIGRMQPRWKRSQHKSSTAIGKGDSVSQAKDQHGHSGSGQGSHGNFMA